MMKKVILFWCAVIVAIVIVVGVFAMHDVSIDNCHKESDSRYEYFSCLDESRWVMLGIEEKGYLYETNGG